MTRRRARLVTLLGVVLALVGLAGYWLTQDVQRKQLSVDQRRLIGIGADDFHVSFVVAGRDIHYNVYDAEPVYRQDGTIIDWNWRGTTSTAGTLTDTILYVAINGDDISMVAIPRDTWLDSTGRRINRVYHDDGAEGLKREVEVILGVPIDYYAIIKLDIFQDLVDALGGVTVDVPYDMHYNDNAAGLHIRIKAGRQVLDGENAGKFVRYRELLRGDIDRIDNVKRLAYAMLQRLKELNVRAVTKMPELIDTFFSDVETNASVGLARQLSSRLGNLDLTVTATLPVNEPTVPGRGGIVLYDPVEVNRFMAATFGGEARAFSAAPDLTLLITDASGDEAVGEWYRDTLVAYGVPPDSVMLRSVDHTDNTPTRLLATLKSWEDADYLADLLNVGKQQVDRFQPFQRRNYQLELVLGADAQTRTSRHSPQLALMEEQN